MDCPITTQYQPTLAAFSAANQQRILQYLALLATRRYAPATLQAIPRTLPGFVRALPPETVRAAQSSAAWVGAMAMRPNSQAGGSSTPHS